ncbi:hypothetical protein KCU61_g278, partial [Aureobasidium melanogenum]
MSQVKSEWGGRTLGGTLAEGFVQAVGDLLKTGGRLRMAGSDLQDVLLGNELDLAFDLYAHDGRAREQQKRRRDNVII